MDQQIKENVEQQYHPLQEMLLPTDKSISDLYLRFIHGYVGIDQTQLEMERGAKISFNTYFNSFYESYWVECAELQDFVLEVECSGIVFVEIFRDTKNQSCNRINWEKLSSDETRNFVVKVPSIQDSVLGEAGRLFVDITAKKNSTVSKVAFQTSHPPRHKPLITLGICTFNREPFLYRNLKEILALGDVTQAIEKIIVVNQGPSFVNHELAKLIDQSDLIKLVEQRNLGGCGGFTRTMHECLEHHDATHHVLMDDDAYIDARVLRNLEMFLTYASQDLVVGGHMLDLLHPWMLYEAGAIVEPSSHIRSLHHNIDLRELSALNVFNKCHYSDYNAWWFCSIPTKHIEEAQFPAPIFIRGDDIEYGVRLQEKGVKTVAMPGIAVWHEPFYVKVGGWQMYYDLRNRLILASVYPNRFSLETPKNVLWLMMQSLALHDYIGATLFARALQDYLKGPVLLDTDAEVIHKEVSQLVKALAPQTVDSTEGLAQLRLRPMPKSEVLIALLLFLRITAALLGGGGKKKPVLFMDNQATVRNVKARPYVKTNGLGSYKLLYSPDRTKLLSSLVLCFKTYIHFVASRKQVASSWNENIGRLRSSAHWKGVFGEAAGK